MALDEALGLAGVCRLVPEGGRQDSTRRRRGGRGRGQGRRVAVGAQRGARALQGVDPGALPSVPLGLEVDLRREEGGGRRGVRSE